MIGAEERNDEKRHVTRRQALKVGGVVIGAAWAAPVISIIGAGSASASPRQGGDWGGGSGDSGSGGWNDDWWKNTKSTPTPTPSPDKTSGSNACVPKSSPPPCCYVVCNYGSYQYSPAAFCFKYDSKTGKYSCSTYNGNDDYHNSSPDDQFKKTFYDNGCWDDKWGSWSSYGGSRYHGALTGDSYGSYGSYQPKSFNYSGWNNPDCGDFVSSDCWPNRKKDCDDIWVPTCWKPPTQHYCTNVKFFCQDSSGSLTCKSKSYDGCYHF